MAHFDGQDFHLDDEVDFEDYLKEKDTKWTLTNPSDMRISPIPAKDVEENLSTVQSLPDETESSSTINVDNVVDGLRERQTRVEIRTHKIIGTYTVEEDEVLPVDSEWKHIYINTQQIAVTELKGTPMEKLQAIVERINLRTRDILLINAELHGLSWAKEHFLKDLNESERAVLREMDRKYKVKARTTEKTAKTTLKKGKTKAQKAVDTFKSLMMSKDAIVKQMDIEKMLDADVRAYIEQVFGSKG